MALWITFVRVALRTPKLETKMLRGYKSILTDFNIGNEKTGLLNSTVVISRLSLSS